MPNFISGVGPVPCIGMVVGEAPGRNEDEQGEPFVGASGRILNEALEAAGVTRGQLYITNAYKYRPPDNRDPTPEELAEHEQYLRAELTAIQPLNILALGRIACSVLTEETSVSRARGNCFPCRLLPESRDDLVFVTFHPAYTIYNKEAREAFFSDIMDFVGSTYF